MAVKIIKADDVVEDRLKIKNQDLGAVFDAQVILMRSPLSMGVDDAVRDCIEELVEMEENNRKKRLCVLIETTGGYIEVVERIYRVFRQHYGEVIFIVPNFAYSAGTVLVLSGDEIYMDYYSVLGPIDPQIDGEDRNGFVPGIGYLNKYYQLMNAINTDIDGTNTRAETLFLLNKFDPAKVFFIEQARDHAVDLLKEWLPKHKFKDWTETSTRREPVNEEMKRLRASEIAEVLGDPERWHSHGRGIGIRELESEEIKLVVNNFAEKPDLNAVIRSYYSLAIDYFAKMNMPFAIHSVLGVKEIS
ncbi:MAG: ATP-dependent Clp protease proteolytic subunit [Magnetococcales bacterium]|nr:ATP-dependent Clp protease proteolytic subunit [Magnetococcales bacterium]